MLITCVFCLVLLETNEEEIIRRFERNDKTVITWKHLSTVFWMWGVGIGIGLLVFVAELLISENVKN